MNLLWKPPGDLAFVTIPTRNLYLTHPGMALPVEVRVNGAPAQPGCTAGQVTLPVNASPNTTPALGELSALTWADNECMFFYSSHFTPTITSVGAAMVTNATTPLTVGGHFFGVDSSAVGVEFLGARGTGACAVTGLNATALTCVPAAQVTGYAKTVSVVVDGFGTALVASAALCAHLFICSVSDLLLRMACVLAQSGLGVLLML